MSTAPRTPLSQRIRTTAGNALSAFYAKSLALAPSDPFQTDDRAHICTDPYCPARSSRAPQSDRRHYRAR
ncbi:hypothetical protein ACIBEA_41675 [Streptomyces sp. NPDC051555]|uniref:hypothetical protein n=1 Tax=Streptomyces sp. NPDC051555 TaxID=3365657 RepID=UPI0037B45302